MKNKIEHINIAVTNKCNLNCQHCTIWQDMPKEELSIENIKNVIHSKSLEENADITLTGGEPFLHSDFTGIVGLILNENPNFLKNISTNGTLKYEMMELFSKYENFFSDFSLHISIDGITKHDEQRGASLKMILENIKGIKEIFPNINIKLKFTITKLNYVDIVPTYEYSKLNNLGFKVKLAENARNYTNKIYDCRIADFTIQEKKSINRALLSIYRDLQQKNNTEAFFINETIKFLLETRKKEVCKTPFNRIFIMPDGQVYSCIHFDSIGNINDKNLEEIWSSKEAEIIRTKVKQHGCNSCIAYHGFSL